MSGFIAVCQPSRRTDGSGPPDDTERIQCGSKTISQKRGASREGAKRDDGKGGKREREERAREKEKEREREGERMRRRENEKENEKQNEKEKERER